jgi:ribulose-5-phosphate 4-epimerase/fuculose-1-phosphate aldolase
LCAGEGAGTTLQHALRNIWVFTKAAAFQVKTLSAAGGDPERVHMVPKAVVDQCMAREMKQQKEPMGQIEFEAW